MDAWADKSRRVGEEPLFSAPPWSDAGRASATDVIDETPFIFNLHHYQTFNGEDNSTLASATVRL
jgi:hypothetical protein